MFHLTEDELQNGFDAITHHGYSAMLPAAYEWKSIQDKWQEIKAHLAQIDLDTYSPYKPLRIFAPKSRASIRIIHLLHPEDLILYSALVLIVKDAIEAARISRRARRVFSYRADTKRIDRFYDSRGAYETYLGQLKQKANKASTSFVAIADIADFYPRINQHRLENVIETSATTQRGVDVARVLVKKLIANLMGRNSYGIPVGPYASRVLGEATLIDVDAHLQSKGVDYVRWVDDYNIFCRSEFLAQSTLFELGEWLYTNHGLTLQASKTKILPVSRYTSEIISTPEENLTDRDRIVSFLRESTGELGYDDDDDEDDEELDEEVVDRLLEIMRGHDLRGMLEDSISDQTLVDYEMVRYVLTRLPRMPGANERFKEDILDIVMENADLLYPASEYIAQYVLSLRNITAAERRSIAKKLLRPLRRKINPPPAYYAMWILYVFSTSKEWGCANDIASIYQDSNSEVIKRYAALAIAVGGARAQALVIKDDFPNASSLLRLAILSASNRLGRDERRHWRLANQMRGVVEKHL